MILTIAVTGLLARWLFRQYRVDGVQSQQKLILRHFLADFEHHIQMASGIEAKQIENIGSVVNRIRFERRSVSYANYHGGHEYAVERFAGNRFIQFAGRDSGLELLLKRDSRKKAYPDLISLIRHRFANFIPILIWIDGCGSDETSHRGPSIKSWGMPVISQFNFDGNIRPVDIESERPVEGYIGIDPRPFRQLQLLDSGIGAFLGGIGGIPVSTVHFRRIDGVDDERDKSKHLHERLGLIPPILFFFACNLAMVLGWLTLRVWANRWLHVWIGMFALVIGFIGSAWSGFLLFP